VRPSTFAVDIASNIRPSTTPISRGRELDRQFSTNGPKEQNSMSDDPQDFEHEPFEQPTELPIEQQQQDPFARATEALQYGSPEEAKAGLIDAMKLAAAADRDQQAIAAEVQESQQVLQSFLDQNPHIKGDKMTEAAGRYAIVRQQIEDLRAYYDIDGWRAKNNDAEVDPTWVGQAHQLFRARRAKGVRTAAQVLQGAAQELSDRYGIKFGPSEDEARSQAINARENHQRRLRGLPPVPVPSNEPVESHNSLAMSPRAFTEAVGFGSDTEPSQADGLADRRSDAVNRMIFSRRELRGQRGEHFVPERTGRK
jgi:hypothetical protein